MTSCFVILSPGKVTSARPHVPVDSVATVAFVCQMQASSSVVPIAAQICRYWTGRHLFARWLKPGASTSIYVCMYMVYDATTSMVAATASPAHSWPECAAKCESEPNHYTHRADIMIMRKDAFLFPVSTSHAGKNTCISTIYPYAYNPKSVSSLLKHTSDKVAIKCRPECPSIAKN
ncbi:hypothetical protein CBL_13455 [Carabus blaptoides fortunei]